MTATLAPHRTTLEIQAADLEPGDRIVEDGFIGLNVDHVYEHAFRAGFMVIDYTIVGDVTGSRTLVAQQSIVVQRLVQGSH